MPNGLDDVTVAETCLSAIDGKAGRLVYRGYDAVEPARRRAFEDVWSLLVCGALPADDAFARRLATLRESPLQSETLRGIACDGAAPMASLAVSSCSSGCMAV